eukprot:scaffold6707_cov114-Cylindrotheca_fusiformis.AAC.1
MQIPKVKLSTDFWGSRPKFEFPRQINGEPGVNATLMNLLDCIIKALGLQSYIFCMLDVPVMDTTLDASLSTDTKNKLLIGSIEGKKPAQTENEAKQIFGSGTQVAGEVFEQLFLTRIQNGCFSIGIISTLQSFQLIATEDISHRTLSAESAKEYFESQRQNHETTPDKQKALVENTNPAESSVAKKPKVMGVGDPKETGPTKNGPVSVEVDKTKTPARKFFATEMLSFGEDEDQNRQVFELLAAYVLLCVQTLKERPDAPLDVTKLHGVCCLIREVNVSQGTFAFKQIKLPQGVLFDEQPSARERHFYVIRQLGFGQTGVCCFACSPSCAPCVIKFYRGDGDFEEAKKEAECWRELYGKDLGFNFVKAYEKPRVLLVLPYLRVPSNLKERKHLVEGEKDSLLYKALLQFANKGFIHKEMGWHHVGLIGSNPSPLPLKTPPTNPGRPAKLKKNTMRTCVPKKRGQLDGTRPETAVFCDLNGAHVEPCNDETARNTWVEESFKNMKACIGEESDQ